jgi:hypothetical protein
VCAAGTLVGSLHTKARAATVRRDLIAVAAWYSATADGQYAPPDPGHDRDRGPGRQAQFSQVNHSPGVSMAKA